MVFFAEVRPFLPIDLPLMRRLTPHGVSLDSTTSLTRGVHTLEGAVWGSVPLADLGTPTFVLRDGEQSYVSQFRHKMGDSHAHIVFIAPDLEWYQGTSAWLHLLDTMVAAAGKRGALTLNAEIDENSLAFEVLREAGFAVYGRQNIWRRPIGPLVSDESLLRPETDHDSFAIQALFANLVPRMVCQAGGLPELGGGFIYERRGQALAYLSVQEGKCGFYIQPFIRPEVYDRAGEILASVWRLLPRAERLPVYLCLQRYQEWLEGTLTTLNFEPLVSQAVMVKHTTSRVEQPEWSRERARSFALPVIDYYNVAPQYQSRQGFCHYQGRPVSKN